jgi:CheY-like chemotaxis protein/anti-sigma regulatory factor (Ser/Thr protein kinase)
MNTTHLDFRSFSPACVVAIDLVKHSQRSKEQIIEIQQEMETVLKEAMQIFRIKDFLVNHTGDGYLCVLIGDASARAMDFVNSFFPLLSKVLQRHNQEFRTGIDFGIVHVRENTITGSRTVFDFSTIMASRLESVADPGSILCTSTVKNVFGYYYEHMFSSTPRIVSTKDREIECYEVTPITRLAGVKELFSNYIFRTQKVGEFISNIVGDRKKILIIDDELGPRESLRMILRPVVGAENLVLASNGREALRVFEPGRFLLVITDLKMPIIDGNELTASLLRIDPGIAVIMVTGYYSLDSAREFFGLGGAVYISKPFDVEAVIQAVGLAIQIGGASGILNNLGLITDDPIGLMLSLEEFASELHFIIQTVPDPENPVHGLLRHKAKHVGMDIIQYLSSGGDVIRFLRIGKLQLKCLKRLTSSIKSAGVSPDIYIRTLIEDLERGNRRLRVEFRCGLEGLPDDKKLCAAVTMVVTELVDNSVTALEGKGKVQIDLFYERSRGILKIGVRDNGPGFDKVIERNLFKEGMTTRGEGRGLGLALVKRTCEIFRGELTYAFDGGAVITASLFI